MKRLLVVVGMLMLAAGVAYGGVVGSMHDMTLELTGVGTSQVCVFCHAPHNALADTGVPLWNRTFPTATYQTYTLVVAPPNYPQPGQPGAISKACLSCHDGSIALNALINVPALGVGGPQFMQDINTAQLVGFQGNLTNHHPVGVDYSPTIVGSNLNQNTTNTVVSTAGTLPLYGTASPYKVECGSCHDPHNFPYPQNNPEYKFLWFSNNQSQLCTTCHNR